MKTLSIVIPVYNEAKRIRKTLHALYNGFSFNGVKLEKIIFVDDGSTDKTKKIIEAQKPVFEKKLKTTIDILSYKLNRGKGYAVKMGMLESTSDYTLFFDADMSTPLSQFKKFTRYLKKGFPVIIATRKNGRSKVIKPQPLYRQILGRGFTFLSNLILGTDVTDFTCGFKLFSREAKGKIFGESRIERWGYDAEIIFLAKKYRFKIKEVSVKWKNDPDSKVNPLKDILTSLKELLEIRINNFLNIYSPSAEQKSLLIKRQTAYSRSRV